MAGFIDANRYDSSTKDYVPEFSWHSNVKELPELPFDKNVLLETYKKSRKARFEKERS
jgi:hypothetical protein